MGKDKCKITTYQKLNTIKTNGYVEGKLHALTSAVGGNE
jgi:hypothetical protein